MMHVSMLPVNSGTNRFTEGSKTFESCLAAIG
jgi:hypothetical protein